jgi:4-hydroxythreonine-4-phosphate dehydrogenase
MNLIISAGDPNGIGLEVLLKALKPLQSLLRSDLTSREVSITLAVHPHTFLEYASLLGFEVQPRGASILTEDCEIHIIPCPTQAMVRFGRIEADAGAMAQEALEIAAREALAGRADAVVTMPVSKYTLKQVGFAFPGQTEFFAARAGAFTPLMILATALPTPISPQSGSHHALRVGLATIHVPLADVPAMIVHELVVERLLALSAALSQDFACAAPRIAVLGLNPHAGEDGTIGTEEKLVIIPALAAARAQTQLRHVQIDGPFPADGFFAHGAYKNYDGVLAMYHDQGLIPLKLIAGGAGVNITAGLPIVRTSPDHGTGYGIAGRGVADPSSVVEAVQMAVEIVRNRRQFKASETVAKKV